MRTSPLSPDQATDDTPIVWDDGTVHRARWCSEGQPRPSRVVVADDALTAKEAYRLVSAGTGILWQGDFQNARQMVRALARRIERPARSGGATSVGREQQPLASVFHAHRRARARRAQLLGLVLVPLEAGYVVPLRRAPDVAEACEEAFGPCTEPSVRSLQEILGAVGASQWRRTGVDVPALGARIHPHYGVFSPVRGEYLDLVAQAPLPARGDGAAVGDTADGTGTTAFDIGTGTGVIAAILARRGVDHVVATDQEPRAVRCARATMDGLGIAGRVEVSETDLFPPGRATLVVCNPPWLPAAVTSSLDAAVYDPGNRMLAGFLAGLPGHLEPGGEGWLIISDLAEHLGLRSREELLRMIADAGLVVVGRLDTRPRHKRADDASDALHAARSAEVTSLWRLRTESPVRTAGS